MIRDLNADRLTEGGGARRGCCGGKRHRPERDIRLALFLNQQEGIVVIAYTEDQEAADNGGVLRVGGLVVDGAQEALLRAGGVGDGDTLGGHFDG